MCPGEGGGANKPFCFVKLEPWKSKILTTGKVAFLFTYDFGKDYIVYCFIYLITDNNIIDFTCYCRLRHHGLLCCRRLQE